MTESTEDPSSSNQFGIMIIGATNRVQDIDPAILRRMPRSFHVDLPNEKGRLSILKLMLKELHVSSDFDVAKIASDEVTKGFSGADLKELCRAAATRHMQEFLDSSNGTDKNVEMRALRTEDFLITRQNDVRPPKEVAKEATSSPSFSSQRPSATMFSELLLSTLLEFHDRQQRKYRDDGSVGGVGRGKPSIVEEDEDDDDDDYECKTFD